MKKIVLLVDMTDTGKPALSQAAMLSKASGAELTVVHIADEHGSDESHQNVVEWFVRKEIGDQVPFKTFIGRGHFQESIPEILQGLHPDLVVVCTHGIHGVKQHLFGANILKLVHSYPYPSLVVQENTVISDIDHPKLMIAASPFSDYMIKVKIASQIARDLEASLMHFEIDKYIGNTEESIANNRLEAEKYLSDMGLRLDVQVVDNTTMSLGYALQTIQFAKEHGVSMIVLSADTHQSDMVMGKADKETFLTNAAGIPILVCPVN